MWMANLVTIDMMSSFSQPNSSTSAFAISAAPEVTAASFSGLRHATIFNSSSHPNKMKKNMRNPPISNP
ncbi:hypothetical protein RHGRI_036379 [Rhododendron griersonianum]|uniref:Uncharacterized protein n=1 Tax=Rhododendron griersonianum TaxID=479676 RepID=A0AAV6HMM4_9ERIC|nr:hypothetical protein RHGRI_036379 [Rhododendron griersonianum]